VGATVSLACAVHRVATPFLLSLLPLVGLQFLAHEGFEWAMLGAALLIAVTSCIGGIRTHGRWSILLAFGAGVLLMLCSHFFSEGIHGVVIGAGVVILSASHLLNRRWCRCCRECSRGDQG
jgi:hypothetical protein